MIKEVAFAGLMWSAAQSVTVNLDLQYQERSHCIVRSEDCIEQPVTPKRAIDLLEFAAEIMNPSSTTQPQISSN